MNAEPPLEPGGSEEEADKAQEKLENIAHALGEHFDSVQIVATKRTGAGETRRFGVGVGDFYARYGAARLWVQKVENDERTWRATQ